CQWSAVMAIVIGSAPRAIGSADSKHTQSAIPFRESWRTGVLMAPGYGPVTPFGYLNVTRCKGALRGGPGRCGWVLAASGERLHCILECTKTIIASPHS